VFAGSRRFGDIRDTYQQIPIITIVPRPAALSMPIISPIIFLSDFRIQNSEFITPLTVPRSPPAP
jgi:hypothetical protein